MISINTHKLAIKSNSRLAADPKDELKWYDLTNDQWEYTGITSEGWKVARNEIIFRRFSHQIPQVLYPDQNYPDDIFDQFLKLLNVKEEDKLLLKYYTIVTFIPDVIKVLMVHDEHGTAKSVLDELLVMIIDPMLTRTLTSQGTKQRLLGNYIIMQWPIMTTSLEYLN